MRILILAFGILLSTGLVNAQYEELVNQKIERLNVLQVRVQAIPELSAIDKAWAAERMAENKALLLEVIDQDLAQLRAVEVQINRTNQAIAGRILAAKKAKLASRIIMLDTMIEQYQAEGFNTTELEVLSQAMKEQLAGLES